MKPQLAPISPIHLPPPVPRITLTGGARVITINNGHSVAVTFGVTRFLTEAPISLTAVRLPPGVQPVQLRTTAPAAGRGDTLTFKPDWTRLVAGTGIVSVHTPAGELTNHPL
jgi:hypothetical protein